MVLLSSVHEPCAVFGNHRSAVGAGMIHNLKEVLMGDSVTNWIATAAVISPVWLPFLMDVSQIAALMLPILGGLWLLVQIWSKIFRNK